MRNYLEFENEIKGLEEELSKLKDPFHKEGISEVDTQSIEKIQDQINFKLQNIYSVSLEVPNISIIVGEGGSGGAVALASTNKVLILENSIYSVISPEGCASILWKDPSKSQLAAKVMKISATDLLKHKIVDEIVPEPIGGAHRDRDEAVNLLRIALRNNLESLAAMPKSEILSQRKNRFLSIGRETKFTSLIRDRSENKILNHLKNLRNKKLFLPIFFSVVVLFFLVFYFYIS